MNIRGRTLLRTSLVFSLALSSFTATASAASVTVNFSGTIMSASSAMTAAHPGVVGGQPGVASRITGTFVYDYSQPGSLTTGAYNFTQSTFAHTLSFSIYPASGLENLSTRLFQDSFTNVGPLNNGGYFATKLTYSSSPGTTFSVMGDSLYKSAMTIPSGQPNAGKPDIFAYNGGVPAFNLTFTNKTNSGYTPTSLPLPNPTVMTHFTTTAATLNWDPWGQSFSAILPDISVAGVPEPSSLVLGIIGLSTGAVFYRRARRRAASAVTRLERSA